MNIGIHEYTQFHSLVSRPLQKHCNWRGDGAGKATPQGVRKSFACSIHMTASRRRFRQRRTGSSKPEVHNSNMGHTKHWRLQALQGRWSRRQLFSGWFRSVPSHDV